MSVRPPLPFSNINSMDYLCTVSDNWYFGHTCTLWMWLWHFDWLALKVCCLMHVAVQSVTHYIAHSVEPPKVHFFCFLVSKVDLGDYVLGVNLKSHCQFFFLIGQCCDQYSSLWCVKFKRLFFFFFFKHVEVEQLQNCRNCLCYCKVVHLCIC